MTKDTDSLSRRSILRLAALAGVPTSAISGVAVADVDRASGNHDRSREIIIGTRDSVESRLTTVDRVTPAGTELVDEIEGLNISVVLPPEDVSTEDAINSIESSDSVEFAERNRKVTTDEAPPRPVTSDDETPGAESYDPSDPIFEDQLAAGLVDADQAWEATLGDSDVTIAIVDSGTKYDHEDLEANMDDSVSNHGTDYVNNSDDPYPRQFGGDDEYEETHGTRVSGIAGAVTDNDVGVAGISNCSLLAVRVLGPDGSGWVSDIASGIEWAAQNGADIINLSLGGSGRSSTYDSATTYAHQQGAMTIASAGNDGERKTDYSPAIYTTMAVSATDEDDDLVTEEEYWWGSNWGPYVDIAAPGLAYWPYTETTDPGTDGEPANEYSGFGGTSMSAPVVSGVAGLVLSVNPDMGPFEVRDHLMETAKDIGLDEEKQGGGRVDAGEAVFSLLEFSYAVDVNDAESDLDVLEGEEVVVTGTVENDGPDIGRADVDLLVDGDLRDRTEDVLLDPDADESFSFSFVATSGDYGATVTVSTEGDSEDRELSVELLDESIRFEDQATAGEELTIADASLSQEFAVVLTDNGQQVGATEPQAGGSELDEHTVSLSDPLTEDTTVTATLHFAEDGVIGEPVEIEGEPVDATADVIVTAAVEYTNEDGIVESPGLRDAVEDWQRGDLSGDGLDDVIDAWSQELVLE